MYLEGTSNQVDFLGDSNHSPNFFLASLCNGKCGDLGRYLHCGGGVYAFKNRTKIFWILQAATQWQTQIQQRTDMRETHKTPRRYDTNTYQHTDSLCCLTTHWRLRSSIRLITHKWICRTLQTFRPTFLDFRSNGTNMCSYTLGPAYTNSRRDSSHPLWSHPVSRIRWYYGLYSDRTVVNMKIYIYKPLSMFKNPELRFTSVWLIILSIGSR